MGLFDTTLGTLLAGIFFNTYLYGLVTYQFAVYCQTKFNDQPATKYMVFFLFILDTFHSLSAIYMAWYYAVSNYDDLAALAGKFSCRFFDVILTTLEVGVWPYPFTAVSTALAAFVTQVFLGFRIWCLTNSKVLYGMVIILAIPSFILGLSCGIAAWIIHVHSELPRITPLVIAWLSMQVVVDIFITVTLVIVFIRARTGFRKTDTILNRLIRGAIQTGLFAGIFSMGDLISFVALPSTNLYGTFAISIGRIYTNTLLDTLLTRELLKTEMEGTDQLGPLSWAPANLSPTPAAQMTGVQSQVQSPGQKSGASCQRAGGRVVPLTV